MQESQSSGFRPVQLQNMARSLKFRIYEEELYCLCSENKGADQLCSYCIFFFLHWQKSGFLMTWLISHTSDNANQLTIQPPFRKQR